MDAVGRPVDERRRAMRQHGTEASRLIGRVLPGHAAQVLNISPGGALLETGCRLMPGAWIELRLAAGRRRTGTRARVVRSAVAGMRSGGILYRGGVKFECPLDWITLEHGAALLVTEPDRADSDLR